MSLDCTTDANGFLVDSSTCDVPFWYTRTGYMVKWALLFAFFTLLGLYVTLGRLHAKRRLKKGLMPLAYHRWLLSRNDLARVDPNYAYPRPAMFAPPPYGAPQAYYTMQPMPPPVYDPNRPPMYPGPNEGLTKVDPSQAYAAPAPAPAPASSLHQSRFGGNNDEEEFQPPQGAPPAAASSSLAAQRTGGSSSWNPFLDPRK